MTTLLRIYNGALRHIQEGRLTSTTESRAARYHLDDAVAEVKAACLEAGFWNFAMRAVEMDASTGITPEFGFTYAFSKPDDWVRTYIVSPNDQLERWLPRFNDEAGVWYADQTPIWAKYVSNAAGYGLNIAAWPQSFCDYVMIELALAAGPAVRALSDDLLMSLERTRKRLKSIALAKDAMNEAPVTPPHGSWVGARGGRFQQRPRSQTLGY
ncbi:MAG: hypothetical protein IT481_08585 [Gammaproteobacteria bacterium]|nr:hypothetical protein [Gammaproteobacteria bacterium]